MNMADSKKVPLTGIGMLLGGGAGVAVGTALGNVGVGTAVGAGAGLLFGMLLSRRKPD